ncbi:MAG TPA: Dabb family protein [Gemmataceae bacterium]|nr:Dabb family protein [Gemmataceae bacterium]
MRRSLLFAMVLMLIGVTARTTPAEEPKADKKGHAPYVHFVVFRMKKDAPKDVVEKAITDCHELLAKIPSVRSVRAGRPAAHGTPDVPKMQYDFALLVLVENAEGLQGYLKHPSHLNYVKKYERFFDMEKLQVFDFLNQMK